MATLTKIPQFSILSLGPGNGSYFLFSEVGEKLLLAPVVEVNGKSMHTFSYWTTLEQEIEKIESLRTVLNCK